jgi:hypothetical protein
MDRIEQGMVAGMAHRPVGGFAWRDADPIFGEVTGDADPAAKGPWLVAEPGGLQRYALFRQGTLVERFDALAKSARAAPPAPRSRAYREMLDRILAFANQFGWLGRPTVVFVHGTTTDEPAEPLEFWLTELDDWCELRELAQALERDSETDRGLLRARVVWRPAGVSYEHGLGRMRRSQLIASARLWQDAELLERLRDGNWRDAIDYFVCREVNNKLRGHVNPSVLPFADRRIRHFMDSLLAGLYFEFARELSGRGDATIEKECANPQCVQLFRPTRRDRRYCSGPCRSLAGYHKRARTRASSRARARSSVDT